MEQKLGLPLKLQPSAQKAECIRYSAAVVIIFSDMVQIRYISFIRKKLKISKINKKKKH